MFEFILPLLVILLGLWVMVSIPVWISAKIFTSGRVSFGQAMGATFLGPLAYIIVFSILNLIQNIAGDTSFSLISFIIAIVAWIGTFKMIFKTGWLATIGIVIVAIIIFLIGAVVASLLILSIPDIPDDILPVPQISV